MSAVICALFKSDLLPNVAKLAVLLCITTSNAAIAANIEGNRIKWHPINVDFVGPAASETDTSPNPFLDWRLSVTFTAPSGRQINVPGFFAGNGRGEGQGNIWRARFAADEAGSWQYKATMRSGQNIAVSIEPLAGETLFLDDAEGQFEIVSQAADDPGFLRYGRLEYTGGHYLKFRDGPYWIKGGVDSPENFLGFAGIDGTVDHGGTETSFLHDFAAHRDDWRDADPLFTNSDTGADSLGIIGALNYLSNQAVNSIYFLPMNLGGDGQDTYPFVGGSESRFNKTHYDISKLHQWNQIFSHAQTRGIALNIQLSETEPENERWFDDGKLGTERKLFFRELIARFGYLLAAKWNLGEENDFPVSELQAHAAYIKALDWSAKPIAVHTQINNFRDYEELMGDQHFSASSIQYDPFRAGEFVEQWRRRSQDSGRPWVIDMDENTGGVSATNATNRRKQILYDVYFSGGNLEWYFGYHPLPLGGDITAGDFRQREAMWQAMRHARHFMQRELPFWRMSPADNLVSGENSAFGGAEVFAAHGEVYAVYLPNASGQAQIDLSGTDGNYSLRWFNPENGDFEGEETRASGGQTVPLGQPPSRSNDDWVVLIKADTAQLDSGLTAIEPANQEEQPGEFEHTAVSEQDANELPAELEQPDGNELHDENLNTPPVFLSFNPPAATAGNTYHVSVTATDIDGVAPAIIAEDLPAGMTIQVVADGIAELSWTVPADATEAHHFTLVAIDARDQSVQTRQTFSIIINAAQPAAPVQPLEIATEVSLNEQSDSQVAQTETALLARAPDANKDHPPLIFGTDKRTVMVGEQLTITIIPVDPEGIVASLRSTDLPIGSSFDDNGDGTRTFRWTPAPENRGRVTVTFIATDAGEVPHVTQSVLSLEVIDQTIDTAPLFQDATKAETANYRPVFAPLANLDIKIGETINLRIHPRDPDGTVPILHVNNLPQGASFNDNGDGSRTFQWTPSPEDPKVVELTFIATDQQDFLVTSTQQLTLSVTQ